MIHQLLLLFFLPNWCHRYFIDYRYTIYADIGKHIKVSQGQRKQIAINITEIDTCEKRINLRLGALSQQWGNSGPRDAFTLHVLLALANSRSAEIHRSYCSAFLKVSVREKLLLYGLSNPRFSLNISHSNNGRFSSFAFAINEETLY